MIFRWRKSEPESPRFDAACFADGPERRFEERAAALRRELEIAQDDKVLLCVGAFESEQRVAVLLDQFLEFRRSGSGAEWRLVLAGKGSEEPLLRRIAAASPSIGFLPPDRVELPVLFRLADLVALVSRAEPGGGTVGGAMASARPVLVSDGIGCAARLVEPGETGWCVDSAHPELWFDYPKAASKERLKKMGEAAARRLTAEFEKNPRFSPKEGG